MEMALNNSEEEEEEKPKGVTVVRGKGNPNAATGGAERSRNSHGTS